MNNYGAKLLLVEGRSDSNFVRSLCSQLQDIPTFDIRVCGGIDNLIRVIKQEAKVPHREVLGVLADANERIEKRRDDLLQRFVATGVDVSLSSAMRPETTMEVEPPVGIRLERIGIWLLPDNQSLGELENLVAEMIGSHDCVWPLAGEYINCIPDEYRKFDPSDQKAEKARVYAWLATRRKPGLIGKAVAKELELDGEVVSRFVAWLRKLFR